MQMATQTLSILSKPELCEVYLCIDLSEFIKSLPRFRKKRRVYLQTMETK